MTLQPGQTVGRYRIIEPLGVGGMATVYKAFQPSLEREVALKVLRPGFAEDPEFFQRFQLEARSIARVRHAHIVQVFDFEQLDGRYVLAMEFLEGGTLKDRMSVLAAEGKRVPRNEIARIVSEVAAALSYAHELGIVHRDIKPSNVMLAGRDRAVVTDFGVAKIVGGAGHTQTGVGIGTPEYMAPEQGTGASVDHRADIYSLGVMAYELLTGGVPFVADTPIAVVLAHMRDPLPLPSSVDPSVDAQTERILLKALAKDPGDRYASAIEFADALHAALVTSAAIDPVPTARVGGPVAGAGTAGRMPRNALIAAGIVTLLALGGGAVAFTRGGAPTATPGGATTSGASGVLPCGPLIYEAKLDAAGSDIQRTGPPGVTATPTPGLRTLDGAMEVTVADAQSFLVINWKRQFPATLYAEYDLKITPGSTFEARWEVWRSAREQSPQARATLTVKPSQETMALEYVSTEPGQINEPETIGSTVAVPGIASGDKVTIGIAVEPQGAFTMLFKGRSIGHVSDTRTTTVGGLHLLSVDVHAGNGMMTLTGFRVYQLGVPQASCPRAGQ